MKLRFFKNFAEIEGLSMLDKLNFNTKRSFSRFKTISADILTYNNY
jgi:hypothetical protein